MCVSLLVRECVYVCSVSVCVCVRVACVRCVAERRTGLCGRVLVVHGEVHTLLRLQEAVTRSREDETATLTGNAIKVNTNKID